MKAGSSSPHTARLVEVARSKSVTLHADGKRAAAPGLAGALTLDHKAQPGGKVASNDPRAALSSSRPGDSAQGSTAPLAATSSSPWKLLPQAVASKVLLYCLTPEEAMNLAHETSEESPDLRRTVAGNALRTMARQVATSRADPAGKPLTDEEALHKLRHPDPAALRRALKITD